MHGRIHGGKQVQTTTICRTKNSSRLLLTGVGYKQENPNPWFAIMMMMIMYRNLSKATRIIVIQEFPENSRKVFFLRIFVSETSKFIVFVKLKSHTFSIKTQL